MNEQGQLMPDLETRRPLRYESDASHVDFTEIPGCLPFSVWDFTTAEARRYNNSIRASLGERREETTREGAATYIGGRGLRTRFTQTTSLFSPSLARAVIRSYSQPGETVFDPFASIVRPYVALAEGRDYIGCEIRPREVERLRDIIQDAGTIHQIDCRDYDQTGVADLVFTCPPYWNQEIYSDDLRDLSTIVEYDDFLGAMREVAAVCYRVLRGGSYCALVLGDFRSYLVGNAQRLIPFTADVSRVFEEVGFERYDQINIVKVPTGFATALCKAWNRRKTVRIHEHLVIFRKVLEVTEIRGAVA